MPDAKKGDKVMYRMRSGPSIGQPRGATIQEVHGDGVVTLVVDTDKHHDGPEYLAGRFVTRAAFAQAGENKVGTYHYAEGPTGGTFTLTSQGETTEPLHHNATVEEVDEAVRRKPGEPPHMEVNVSDSGKARNVPPKPYAKK